MRQGTPYSFNTLLLLLVLPGASLSAGTIEVCWDGTGDYLTIQQGIDASIHGDEVVVCPGTYSGTGNKNLDYGVRAITLRSQSGPESTVIDCGGSGRGFRFHFGEGPGSVLDGFTIRNGAADRGAAIECRDFSAPTIRNCVLESCTSTFDGGAIYCTNFSDLFISNMVLRNNAAGTRGGAISISDDSSMVMVDCILSKNEAQDDGGAIYSIGDLSMINCVISGSQAFRGGAAYLGLSTFSMVNTTFTGNLAERGGAINLDIFAELEVINSILWNNSATFGPSFYINSNNAALTVSHSDVQGGLGAVWGTGSITWDPSNIAEAPLFIQPGFWLSGDWVEGNYRLATNSPCIDSGNNNAVWAGVVSDVNGGPRFLEDPQSPNIGVGTPPIVDRGAYEYFPDCNNNGTIDTLEPDGDGDGVINDCDQCPGTAPAITVNAQGCPIRGACCFPGDLCVNNTASQDCASVGGSYLGHGTTCTGDFDGDGAVGCDDGCPMDGTKTEPGICGCGVSDSVDTDADGVVDCLDQCAGTPPGTDVNAVGCPRVGACCFPAEQVCLDDVEYDLCPLVGGIYQGELLCQELADGDGDGVSGCDDYCPGTLPGLSVDADGCSATVPADYDGDGDVDGDDLHFFQNCARGSEVPYVAVCADKDHDGDGDVDQYDFAVFQRCCSGAGIPADPNCAN